jgi:filamin
MYLHLKKHQTQSHPIIISIQSSSVDTRAAGHGQLGVTVEGPVECLLNCRDMGNGTCDIYYLPTECGDYTVNITFNDRHILGSPFQALIFPTPNLDRVKVTGAGIELHGKVGLR